MSLLSAAAYHAQYRVAPAECEDVLTFANDRPEDSALQSLPVPPHLADATLKMLADERWMMEGAKAVKVELEEASVEKLFELAGACLRSDLRLREDAGST